MGRPLSNLQHRILHYYLWSVAEDGVARVTQEELVVGVPGHRGSINRALVSLQCRRIVKVNVIRATFVTLNSSIPEPARFGDHRGSTPSERSTAGG